MSIVDQNPADYDARVFINCPFDAPFKPIFDAIVFSIHDLGFVARHALIDDATAIRVERIAAEIVNSRYSVHDMSRVQLGKNRLPRFNMPFEAGVAYAAHALRPFGREHHFGVLDEVSYQYQASISDLAGLDPKIHHGDPDLAIKGVRDFLRKKSGRADLPGAAHVIKRYAAFRAALKAGAARASNIRLTELKSWDYVNDLQHIMAEWITANPS